MGKPVADVVESGVVGEGIFGGSVAVCIDEHIHRLLREYLAGILHLRLLFALESKKRLVVGGATFTGKETGYGVGLARMQHTVQHTVGLEAKNALDEQITALVSPDAITVPDNATFAVEVEDLLLEKDLATKRLGEIILHPHVVIAREIVYLNAIRVKFRQLVKKSEIAFGHHILILKPKVEHVAQKEEVLHIIFLLLQQIDKHILPDPAFRLGGASEVGVGDEAGIAFNGDGMSEVGIFHY